MFNSLPVIKKENINVMSSVDLAKLCVGESKNSHSNFMAKAKLVLKDVLKFQDISKDSYNRDRTILLLPERESCLMAMSYSYELQAKVYDAWQSLRNEKPSWLISLSPEAQIAIADLDRQRLEAIATKAEIGSRREATAMATASVLSRKVKSLENRLQDIGKYQSIIAAQLPQRIETETNSNAQTWRVLMKMCKEMSLPPKKVKDQRYGEVNTYHVDVINKFIEEYL